jgi:hypothetical protein
MTKRDMRRWAYRQMRFDVKPWPRWAIALFWSGLARLIGLKLMAVIHN